MLDRLLRHPLAVETDIDSPEAAMARARIVRSKGFLERIYREWYDAIAAAIPDGEGAVVEIGASGGFFHEILPEVVRTDLVAVPGLDAVLDSRKLPFDSGAIRALTMTNVFHHIPDASLFLDECERCLRPGGRLIMWEPWVTTWSRWVYRHLHHEPFDPDAEDWAFAEAGPLSGANEALPWIVFARDRQRFAENHPLLQISEIRPAMPFCYLASGGVGFRTFLPDACYPVFRAAERLLGSGKGTLAMFAFIKLERRANG